MTRFIFGGGMDVQKISSGSAFEAVAGYSRAIVVEHADHKEVFVSGCSGFDYATMTISDDVVVQARQCFINIAAALEKAGGDLSHVTRVRYYITDGSYWELAAPVFGEALAAARPAATCLVCGLVDAGMKIEIEVDARIPR
jgi:enamine deaminase RidA (YjgF/YER057c/UK114 family)